MFGRLGVLNAFSADIIFSFVMGLSGWNLAEVEADLKTNSWLLIAAT